MVLGQEETIVPCIVPYSKAVTNNVGEYRAVILALEEAHRWSIKQVELLTDSQLVVEQVKGNWKVRHKHLLPLRDRVKELLTALNGTLEWIPREENLAGKVLERRK